MKLHNDNDEFRAAIEGASEKLLLPPYVVEKDYWVTQLLQNVSRYEHYKYVVFKGGTSLSKGYKLIKRFSEDIDLAFDKRGIGKGLVATREGDALHKITKKIVDGSFTNIEEEQESEKYRYKRVYEFPRNFNYPVDSPIHEKIVLEVNSFATPSPSEDVLISSLVSQYLVDHGGQGVLSELDMEVFSVRALAPERTFCEKILAIRRASYKGLDFFGARIRHVYDIHQLYCSPRVGEFVANIDKFQDLLSKSYEDDLLNQTITSQHGSSLVESPIFLSPVEKLSEVKTQYNALKNITFDRTLPSLDDVAETLTKIGQSLKDYSF